MIIILLKVFVCLYVFIILSSDVFIQKMLYLSIYFELKTLNEQQYKY